MTSPPLRRQRATGWTADRQRQFITDLREVGCVRTACARAGLSRASAYKLRDRSEPFAKVWDAALVVHQGDLLDEALRRVTTGSVRPILYRGQVVGQRIDYSDRLLAAALSRTKANLGGRW
jgi:hypothetical protein